MTRSSHTKKQAISTRTTQANVSSANTQRASGEDQDIDDNSTKEEDEGQQVTELIVSRKKDIKKRSIEQAV